MLETTDALSAHDDKWSEKLSQMSGERHSADLVTGNQLQRTERIRALLSDKPGRRVLDVGCGFAHLVRALAEQGHQAHGCDISEELINYHREHSPFAEFKLSRIDEKLPYDEGAFDVVISSEVVEHVYDVLGFLRQLARCVRPGGSLVLTTPYHGVRKIVALTLAGKFETHFDPLGQHIRFFTPKSLSRCLSQCGLKMTRWQGLGRVPGLWKTMLVEAIKPS